MKKIAILRFGLPLPHALEELTAKQFANGEAMCTSFGVVGVIIIMETEYSANTIATWMAETHATNKKRIEEEGKKATALPFIVFDLNSEDVGHTLDTTNDSIKRLFSEMKVETLQPFTDSVVKCTMSLDELLEIVHRKGMQSLTPEMKARLDELSKKE